MPRTYDLGDWIFTPDAQELKRREQTVRLEHRAARALELLCERRGEVVSQADLTQRLWQGRQVSDNSLAVVIGDLRRALGDSARQPRFVETVAKAGYRLIAPMEASTDAAPAPAPDRRLVLAGLGGFVLLAIGSGYWLGSRPRLLLIGAVENATGEPAYDNLARACSDLILDDLGRERGLRLQRAAPGAALPAKAVRLTARLTLWTGLPYLALSAEDARSVVWSGSVLGPEAALPGRLEPQLAALADALRGDHPSRTKP